MAPTNNIHFHPCAKAKVYTTIVKLTDITTARPAHPTIKLALEYCQAILITETQINKHLELCAREFLGCAKVLFDQRATFYYSNPGQIIHYTLPNGEANDRILSNRLWSEPTIQDTTALVSHMTDNNYNNNLVCQIVQQTYPTINQIPQGYQPIGAAQDITVNYEDVLDNIAQIHETPSEHAAGIQEETQSSINRFNDMKGKVYIQNWFDARGFGTSHQKHDKGTNLKRESERSWKLEKVERQIETEGKELFEERIGGDENCKQPFLYFQIRAGGE